MSALPNVCTSVMFSSELHIQHVHPEPFSKYVDRIFASCKRFYDILNLGQHQNQLGSVTTQLDLASSIQNILKHLRPN